MKTCDLHTHSIFSDGTSTPAEIINEAIKSGLSAVALCDHNTADGLPDFLKAARNMDIEAVAGVEFSVDYQGTELHLLALFVPEHRFSQITDLMNDYHQKVRQCNRGMIETLNQAGYAIDYDEICQSSPTGNFNRAHIAAELTRKGYTESISEAFDTLLSPENNFYKQPKRLSVFDMIPFISSIGAVSILAHPFLNLSKDELEDFLPLAKKAGLDGLECYYSLFDETTTNLALELAEKYDLKISGGSDFHGDNKPDIQLGSGKNNLFIPYSIYETLKK